MAKKDKIILICIGTLILIGIIGFLVSGGEQNSSNSNKKQELPGNPTDTKTKVKNPDIPKTQTYTLTRSYSGKEAYISFFSNYYCSVDFSSFSGEGYLGGDLYLSLEYPPAGGNCKYTQEDDIITVTYNGVVRKKVESGKAVLEDYFRNIMPTIQFKYDRDSKTVDMTPLNGRWEQFGASGGLDMVYFIENGSEEDLKEKKEQEQAQKEKAQQEQNAEEMSKEAIQNSLNQTTITLNDSSGNQTGDKETVTIKVNASNGIISITVNGEEIMNRNNEITLQAAQGVNTYTIIIKGEKNLSRTETITYTFNPKAPVLNISNWETSCYLKIWTSGREYNSIDNISLYYDESPLQGNSNITKQEKDGNDLYIYSKAGTHTIKAVNKYGLVTEKTYTFPEKCG